MAVASKPRRTAKQLAGKGKFSGKDFYVAHLRRKLERGETTIGEIDKARRELAKWRKGQRRSLSKNSVRTGILRTTGKEKKTRRPHTKGKECPEEVAQGKRLQ